MKLLVTALFTVLAIGAWASPLNLVFEEECHVFEWMDEGDYYHFYQDLGGPFYQEAGQIYWLAIIGVSALDNIWYWQLCVPEDYWRYEAEWWSNYWGVPTWTPLSEAVGTYFEMAFVLHGTQGEKWRQNPSWENGIASTITPTYDGEAADDFLCEDGDPIVALEWWGWPGTVPDYFIIRFYTDSETTATENTSWSDLKTLY